MWFQCRDRWRRRVNIRPRTGGKPRTIILVDSDFGPPSKSKEGLGLSPRAFITHDEFVNFSEASMRLLPAPLDLLSVFYFGSIYI